MSTPKDSKERWFLQNKIVYNFAVGYYLKTPKGYNHYYTIQEYKNGAIGLIIPDYNSAINFSFYGKYPESENLLITPEESKYLEQHNAGFLIAVGFVGWLINCFACDMGVSEIFNSYYSFAYNKYKETHKRDIDSWQRDLEAEFAYWHYDDELSKINYTKQCLYDFLQDDEIEYINEYVNNYLQYIEIQQNNKEKPENIISINEDITNYKINAEYFKYQKTFVPIKKGKKALPEELDNDTAKKYLERAREQGLIINDYEWIGTKTLLAYFTSILSQKLNLNKRVYENTTNEFIPVSWSPCEKLFGIKNLRCAYYDQKEKIFKKPMGYEAVDKIFDIQTNRDY